LPPDRPVRSEFAGDAAALEPNPDRLATGCPLPRRFLKSIQAGTMTYSYKGVPTYKNPFDLALYQLLLWEQKPRTIIEIGSKWGGSALWFADILKNFEIDFQIHSVDLTPPTNIAVPGVVFHRGDGRDLASTFPAEKMAELPRPLMVIEDADHRPETTLAVLDFFDRWLNAGEYIVIEDGIVNDLLDEATSSLAGGPRAAVADFLRDRDGDYEIDTRFCDFFGVNMTWNVNGYLRRVR
jgi:cephalosporin hydroxylase